MFKRKVLAVALLLIMTATLTVGCTQVEKEFIGIYEEISQLTTYENSGSFTIRITGIPYSSDNLADAIVLGLLQNGLKVNYSGKINLEQNMFDYSFFIADEATGINTELFRLLCKNDVLYIKIDNLLKLANSNEEVNKIFANTKYISISKDEYLQMLSGSNDLTLTQLNQNGFTNYTLNQVVQKFICGLPEVYEDFSTGAITKDGNKYTLAMNGKGLAELFLNNLEYSIANITVIGNYISSFLDNLNNEELECLGLDPQTKQLCQGYISMGIAEVERDKATMLEEIKEMRTELYEDEDFNKILDGIYCKYSIEKKGNQLYEDTAKITINIEENDAKIGMDIDVLDKIKGIAPFTIEVPTAQVMTYTEYLAKVGKTIKIEVDHGYYTFKHGFNSDFSFIDVKIIENRTYLPMRKVAETFGEQVTWDSTAAKAYVIKNGNNIDMTGTIIDDRTYIKIRDFEKIGYKVDWDEKARTVSITSPAL
jgi:hypothetical protein